MTCPYLNSQWVTSAETAGWRILHSFEPSGRMRHPPRSYAPRIIKGRPFRSRLRLFVAIRQPRSGERSTR
jgi:hypothetical protein